MVEMIRHIGPAEVPFRGQWASAADAPPFIRCNCGGQINAQYSGEYAFFNVECDGCKQVKTGKFLRPAGISEASWAAMVRAHNA